MTTHGIICKNDPSDMNILNIEQTMLSYTSTAIGLIVVVP